MPLLDKSYKIKKKFEQKTENQKAFKKQAFEKKAILKWIRDNENTTHPLTRELIKEEDLEYADDVYTQIFNFKSLYPYHPDINK